MVNNPETARFSAALSLLFRMKKLLSVFSETIGNPNHPRKSLFKQNHIRTQANGKLIIEQSNATIRGH